MGGKCHFIGPACTDNFQIVEEKFIFRQWSWWSVEQAYQASKFGRSTVPHHNIAGAFPADGESDEDFGMRVWNAGQQDDGWPMVENWEEEKVKVMLLANVAKFESSELYRTLLAATGTMPIVAQPSTWEWQFWNSRIMVWIRRSINDKRLSSFGFDMNKLSGPEVMEYLRV